MVCITTDNLNGKYNVLLIGNLMKMTNSSISKASYFFFGFLSCCCVEHNKYKGTPLIKEHISLILESYLWHARFLFLKGHLMI